ncbi:MAG: [FeFe] hydrogenase H-cluster maturation GTPase HydF [Bradymonadales bacterium]|nr:[FeFe] hydrogenase H-cluster maturation GTPase HydF [Bradymonadales bacterium]
MSQKTPKGFRLHIGLFGRRNVGKSSILNAMTRQQVSIVSDSPGTTTDPVHKPMELLPLGPVLFIDTAGIDDLGELGNQRVKKTASVYERTDLGVIVSDGPWGPFEEGIAQALRDREIPVVAVFNKVDRTPPSSETLARLDREGVRVVRTSALVGAGISELRQAILDSAPPEFLESPPILFDLVGSGELAVLVVPIDKEAPKGRLILPQVQSIRDLLDGDAWCLVVKEGGLKEALNGLKRPPKLVVTDSQAFLQVAADTPAQVPMTSFSILFARLKGDLLTQTEGVLAVEGLKEGDRVLVAEACAHHPIEDDIGRVKIPRWIEEYVGAKLDFVTVQGHDLPEDLSSFRLVIHCGACMFNRREMLNRLRICRLAGVPITNYGLVIAHSLGILDRALGPFPVVQKSYRAGLAERGRSRDDTG